jgi:hypothetical protein
MKTTKNARGTFSRFAVIAAVLGAMTTVACAHADSTDNAGPQLAMDFAGASTVGKENEKGPPQGGVPDVKMIGLFEVSTADEPGTWWWLTRDRFDSLGVTDYKAVLEGFYGQGFDTLDDAIQFLIDLVATWDTNGNGYVCAYEVRGKRAYLGETVNFLFGIDDDKFAGR